MRVRGVREWPLEGGDFFDRAQVFTTTPGQNGWTIADTSAAGAPTYLCITEDGGAAKLTLAATSELEIVTLYMNDVLPLDLASLQSVEFVAKVEAIDAVTTLVFGVGSARNDTSDTVATSAWFRMEGSASTSNVVVETDDGVVDRDDPGRDAGHVAEPDVDCGRLQPPLDRYLVVGESAAAEQPGWERSETGVLLDPGVLCGVDAGVHVHLQHLCRSEDDDAGDRKCQ